MDYAKVGEITHYFDKIGVGVLKITDNEIKTGDKLRIGEFESGFEQKLESMEVDHKQVDEAKIGDEVGLKINQPIKKGIFVYKINE